VNDEQHDRRKPDAAMLAAAQAAQNAAIAAQAATTAAAQAAADAKIAADAVVSMKAKLDENTAITNQIMAVVTSMKLLATAAKYVGYVAAGIAALLGLWHEIKGS